MSILKNELKISFLKGLESYMKDLTESEINRLYQSYQERWKSLNKPVEKRRFLQQIMVAFASLYVLEDSDDILQEASLLQGILEGLLQASETLETKLNIKNV